MDELLDSSAIDFNIECSQDFEELIAKDLNLSLRIVNPMDDYFNLELKFFSDVAAYMTYTLPIMDDVGWFCTPDTCTVIGVLRECRRCAYELIDHIDRLLETEDET